MKDENDDWIPDALGAVDLGAVYKSFSRGIGALAGGWPTPGTTPDPDFLGLLQRAARVKRDADRFWERILEHFGVTP